MALTYRELILQPDINRLTRQFEAYFARQHRLFMRLFARTKTNWIEEADAPIDPHEWEQYWELLQMDGATAIAGSIDQAVQGAMIKGGLLGTDTPNVAISFTLKNTYAQEYLQNYGSQRISQVNSATKGYINNIINKAMGKGESYQQTAKKIGDMYSQMYEKSPLEHIKNRAELIAVTETGNAYSEASLIQSKALQYAGLPMEKSWLTVGDNRVSEACASNEAAGWIPLDDLFPAGDDRPLNHPGCRCTLLTQMRMPE